MKSQIIQMGKQKYERLISSNWKELSYLLHNDLDLTLVDEVVKKKKEKVEPSLYDLLKD